MKSIILLLLFKLSKLVKRPIEFIFNELKDISNNEFRFSEHLVVSLSHHQLKRPYRDGEKIVIVFLFQAASFWPSWESVWDACNEDIRINPIMLVCDYDIKEKTQFKSAQNFLTKKNIKFKHVSDVNLEDISPHIIILQTPYDGHRPFYLRANRLSSKGYRIVYIPYGIEISDSIKARQNHFQENVTTNAWRLYTFSKEIVDDYKMLSPTGGDMVRAYGHPKFDYFNKNNFPTLPDEIVSRANGRKVVLWKVHFPRQFFGKMITPPINMYLEFLDHMANYKNLFFVFMPHPKFFEELDTFYSATKFKKKMAKLENIYEFNDDEYRSVLLNCDFYIIDRSALMIEAGATNKPILYVNAKMVEPMTKPVQKIIDSYYQAYRFADIKNFLDDVVLKGNDPLKKKRIESFKSVIHIDGKSGYRIKEDMISSLKSETSRQDNLLVS